MLGSAPCATRLCKVDICRPRSYTRFFSTLDLSSWPSVFPTQRFPAYLQWAGDKTLRVQGPFLRNSCVSVSSAAGWWPRPPLVAPSDRERVLRSWAPFCSGEAPRQRYIPFTEVRMLSPEEFVRVLAEDLHAKGVVVGRNYRFGYKVVVPGAPQLECRTRSELAMTSDAYVLFGMRHRTLDPT
jgi:FAD synthetase